MGGFKGTEPAYPLPKLVTDYVGTVSIWGLRERVDCWQLWAPCKPNAVLHTRASETAPSRNPRLPRSRLQSHWHLQLQLHTCRWQTPSWRYFWRYDFVAHFSRQKCTKMANALFPHKKSKKNSGDGLPTPHLHWGGDILLRPYPLGACGARPQRLPRLNPIPHSEILHPPPTTTAAAWDVDESYSWSASIRI